MEQDTSLNTSSWHNSRGVLGIEAGFDSSLSIFSSISNPSWSGIDIYQQIWPSDIDDPSLNLFRGIMRYDSLIIVPAPPALFRSVSNGALPQQCDRTPEAIKNLSLPSHFCPTQPPKPYVHRPLLSLCRRLRHCNDVERPLLMQLSNKYLTQYRLFGESSVRPLSTEAPRLD